MSKDQDQLKHQADVELQMQQAYAELFSSQNGQTVLRHLMGQFHIFRTSPQPDPYAIAFNEGERNVVLYILSQLQKGEHPMTPEEFIAAAREGREEYDVFKPIR